MERCLELAANGLGKTYPNPMVGAVIALDDTIIGEGWHQKAGTPHAEVHAVRSVPNPEVLKDATIYVSLEPCSHHGRTPPCADLIIEKGFRKVVVAALDPNPIVAGRGIERIRNAGIEVEVGVLEAESIWLNRRFFTVQEKKRPHVILKWAQSQDDFIAPTHRDQTGPVWISSKWSKQWVHKLRGQEQAILVGTQTALDDDPALTTRYWEGSNPLRVLIDRKGLVPETAQILNEDAPTLVFTEQPLSKESLFELHTGDFDNNLPQQILQTLYDRGIQSLIVEGGLKTLQGFIDLDLWDEAYRITGPMEFGSGVNAPRLDAKLLEAVQMGPDQVEHLIPNNA